MPVRIAIIGYGAIAKAQHVPAIAADPRFELVAVASPGAEGTGVRTFDDHRDMIREMAGKLDAVSIATPPGPRYAIARDCLAAGLACLLEKPPAATLGEIADLARIAERDGRVLFTAWHSQHAPGVAAARQALEGKRIARLAIDWRESVAAYHAGQDWIWEAGGFGVFDPGINAFSIASRIVDAPLFVEKAELIVPSNKQSPIAASLGFKSPAADGPMSAELDWRATEDRWTIRVEAAGGPMVELSRGGSALSVDGAVQPIEEIGEYPALYAHFARLIERKASDVDWQPLRIVADAFLLAHRTRTEPFSWT